MHKGERRGFLDGVNLIRNHVSATDPDRGLWQTRLTTEVGELWLSMWLSLPLNATRATKHTEDPAHWGSCATELHVQ